MIQIDIITMIETLQNVVTTLFCNVIQLGLTLGLTITSLDM